MPVLAIVMMMSCGATAAFAQGSYVSAAVLADIVRATHTDYPGAPEETGGEAIGFALRAGTPLGGFWGVEVEFARPGQIEAETQFGPISIANPPIALDPLGGLTMRSPLIPPFSYEVETRERNTTLSAALWLQQQLTARFAMVYLGGVAFSRSEFESDVRFAPLFTGLPIGGLVTLPPARTESIVYGVQPVVGVESRIDMTGQARLVPGLRMQASDGRWFIRPSVGIAWTF